MRKSAIVRIVVYALLAVLLLGLLCSALVFRSRRSLPKKAGAAENSHASASGYPAADQGPAVRFPADSVEEIQIEWVAGDLEILPGAVDGIQVLEEMTECPMEYSLRDGKLKIRFCKDMHHFSFGLRDKAQSKDLTVTVPESWLGEKISIESVSSDVKISGLTLEKLEYEGVSGKFDLNGCTIGELDAETVSGRMNLSGEVMELECESVSADCELTLTNVPDAISMDGVSGKLKLVLPGNAGFTVKLEGLSKDLDTDFPVTRENGRYVSGDGSCRIEVEGISGNVEIRKAQ